MHIYVCMYVYILIIFSIVDMKEFLPFTLELTQSFREQVESMRREGGEHWLSFLNELKVSPTLQDRLHMPSASVSSQLETPLHGASHAVEKKESSRNCSQTMLSPPRQQDFITGCGVACDATIESKRYGSQQSLSFDNLTSRYINHNGL